MYRWPTRRALWQDNMGSHIGGRNIKLAGQEEEQWSVWYMVFYRFMNLFSGSYKFLEPLDLRFPSFLHSFHGPFKLLFSSNRDIHQPRSKRGLNCPSAAQKEGIIAIMGFTLLSSRDLLFHFRRPIIPRTTLSRISKSLALTSNSLGKNPLKYFVSRCFAPQMLSRRKTLYPQNWQ